MKEKSLLYQALVKGAAGFVLLGALLFGPAGTFDFPGAWLLLGLLFVPMGVLCAVLYRKAPQLLKKRLGGTETRGVQKGVVALSGLLFLAAFVLAGLDRRFGWTQVPLWLQTAAAVLQLLSYGLYAEVMRENAYLSRTIELQTGQTLIDTGLYGVVRHPMYSATIVLFLSMALVTGSFLAFLVMLPYPAVIAVRILNEEAMLEGGLEGYAEYKKTVRYRLIPYLW